MDKMKTLPQINLTKPEHGKGGNADLSLLLPCHVVIESISPYLALIHPLFSPDPPLCGVYWPGQTGACNGTTTGSLQVKREHIHARNTALA